MLWRGVINLSLGNALIVPSNLSPTTPCCRCARPAVGRGLLYPSWLFSASAQGLHLAIIFGSGGGTVTGTGPADLPVSASSGRDANNRCLKRTPRSVLISACKTRMLPPQAPVPSGTDGLDDNDAGKQFVPVPPFLILFLFIFYAKASVWETIANAFFFFPDAACVPPHRPP